MKILRSVLFCLAFFQFVNASENIEFTDTICSYDCKTMILLTRFNEDVFWKVPNKFIIHCNTDKIEKITSNNGRIVILNDSIFEIIPSDSDKPVKLSFVGKNQYNIKYPIEKLQKPDGISLKGIPYEPDEMYRSFTIDDLEKSNQLIGIQNGYKFKITQFYCRVHSKIKYPDSPVFNSDSFSSEYIKFLREIPIAEIMLHDVHFLAPDSTEKHCEKIKMGTLLKDSASLILYKYGGYNKVRSNVRIKISGIPTSQDIETIENVISELNTHISTIKVKLVDHLPSIIISFDTISTPFKSNEYGLAILHQQKPGYPNPLYPGLINSNININTTYYNQTKRDSILWRAITNSLFTYPFYLNESQNSIIIGYHNQNQYTYEDKLALKTIFSKGNSIKEVWGDFQSKLPSLDLVFIILLVILFSVILNEVSLYYGILRKIKIKEIRQLISALVIVQIVMLMMYLIDKNLFNTFSLQQYEIYFCGFAIVLSQLFILSDSVLDKIKTQWIRLSLNVILSIVSLFIAYQIIYLFVRGEILRFETIEIKAKTIAISILIVRFFVQYQKSKMATLLQEKEYELTKQKEMKNRAELKALQARINPHFLYNALNSIASLANLDSKRTENMALSLSKLFRYNVNRDEQLVTSLGQEIEMVQLYLEIEKERFGKHLIFNISVDNSLYEREIPRFLIQPLIENAILHGTSKITEPGIISLKIYNENENLVIEVHDNGPDFPDGLLSGYGLQNTYDKLNLIHKKPFDIKFVNHPEKFIQIKL